MAYALQDLLRIITPEKPEIRVIRRLSFLLSKYLEKLVSIEEKQHLQL